MSKVSHTTWGTESELTFIAKLGRWTGKQWDRTELLAGYVQAMNKRHEWGDIDPWRVQEVAQMYLAQEESHG